VRVGCKEIPFTSVQEAVDEFAAYVADPYAAIQKWEKIFNQ
jgi:hypothetical protein